MKPCDGCGIPAGRKAHVAELGWLCVKCIVTFPCETCGEPTRAGIDRFAVGTCESDEYRLTQAIVNICKAGHLHVIAIQDGPGKSSKPTKETGG